MGEDRGEGDYHLQLALTLTLSQKARELSISVEAMASDCDSPGVWSNSLQTPSARLSHKRVCALPGQLRAERLAPSIVGARHTQPPRPDPQLLNLPKIDATRDDLPCCCER